MHDPQSPIPGQGDGAVGAGVGVGVGEGEGVTHGSQLAHCEEKRGE